MSAHHDHSPQWVFQGLLYTLGSTNLAGKWTRIEDSYFPIENGDIPLLLLMVQKSG